MKVYDIFHVDDDPDVTRMTGRMFQSQGFTYFSVPSLNSMKHELEENTGRYFVVDGKFPRNVGERVEFLAQEAIEYIRTRADDPKIILFSNNMNNLEIAENLRVDCTESKYDEELFNMISQMEGR